MVPFHMLGIVSSCAIVTLSLSRAVFPIFDFKKCRDLETWVKISQGHWKCHHAIERIRLPIGLSHARPNSGISGDLLSENEAKPAVI